MNGRLKKIASILACPACKGGLVLGETHAQCTVCRAQYAIQNGKIYFSTPPASGQDTLDGIKYHLKRLFGQAYYRVGVTMIAPTYPFNFAKEVKRHVDPATDIVIDIGAGAMRIDDNVICVDIFDYDNIDIVCDIKSLPFKDNSVSAFVSRSALEHVPEPNAVIDEIRRCTSAGGISAHLIPFMMPFHASPYDFQRYTHIGALKLFPNWTPVEQFAPFGPVTLLLQSVIEIASSLFSFGNARAKSFLYLALCVPLFPVKFLDFFFVRRKSLIGIAPSIFTVVRKETTQ